MRSLRVNLKDFLLILQNLNWQKDKVQINTMQDATDKVSLGTHSLSLDIYYIPHCHELWPQLDLEMFVSSQMPLINWIAGRVRVETREHFLPVDDGIVGTNKRGSCWVWLSFPSSDCCEEGREEVECDDPRHPGHPWHRPQQSRQPPGSHLRYSQGLHLPFGCQYLAWHSSEA